LKTTYLTWPLLLLLLGLVVFQTLISCNKKQVSDSKQSLPAQAMACLKAADDLQFLNEDSSLYYYEKALAISSASSTDTIGPYVLFGIARLNYRAFNYKVALELFDSAMTEANRHKKYKVVSNCLNELGAIESDLNNSEQSRIYFNKALQIAEQHQLDVQKGVILANMARFETNPDSALKILKQAISILINTREADMEYCSVLMNMATRIPDNKKAIKLYYEVINIAEKAKYSETVIAAYNNLACTYLDCNQIREAEVCLRDHAIPEAKKSKNTDWLSTVFESYSEVFEKRKDFQLAYLYEKLSLKTRIEASQKQAATQNRLLNALLRAKNREIDIKEKAEEIKTKHDQLNRMYVWLSVLVLLIILVVVISFLWIQRKNLKLKIQEIDAAKRLSAIEEKEHERLSMQIHDLIGPLSSGMMKHLEGIDFRDQEVKQLLITRLSEAGSELRRISHRLNPLMREQMTFNELVKSIREDYQGRSELIVNLQLPPKEPELSKETINQLYFILHELLMNARKYVKTGNIGISITEEMDNLYILYEDDGPGFEPKEVQLTGLGLMHIFERVKLLKGKADLDSSPGHGTRWTISINLEK